MPISTPPKFKILVANLAASGDPSVIGGNPVKLRTGFELQQVVLPNGTARIGGPIQAQPVVDATHYTVAIQVLSALYWDPAVTPPGPFYFKEEVQCFTQYPVASESFGVGIGSGGGPVGTVATELATYLNTLDRVSAVAIADTVYINSSRPDETIPVKASNDMAVLLGGTMFRVLGPGGVVLTGTANQRQTFFIFKAVKTQAPPTILP